MNCAEWIQNRHASGVPIECIAAEALRGSIQLPGGVESINDLLEQISVSCRVMAGALHPRTDYAGPNHRLRALMSGAFAAGSRPIGTIRAIKWIRFLDVNKAFFGCSSEDL